MYDIIRLTVGSYAFWIIVLGVIGLIQRKQEGEPPEWRKRALTKEQQILVNAQYHEYRKGVYKNYPQVETFERNKKLWAAFLTLIYFVTYVLNLFATIKVTGISATLLGIGVCFLVLLGGSLIVFGVFLMAMGPKWQLALLLYVIGIGQIISRLYTFVTTGIDSWDKIRSSYIEIFRILPVAFVADILVMVFTALILLTAVWLTAFKRNRELAKQSDILNAQLNRDFTPTGI